MPSNEQRRQAAKRKLQRQLARRAERAKRRKLIAAVVAGVVVVIVVGAIYAVATTGGDKNSSAAGQNSTPPPPQTSTGPCKYVTTPDQPAPSGRVPGLPPDPVPTNKSGTVALTLKTSAGDIPLTLDRAQASCTVQSIEHLAQAKFYDGTPCHRLTTIDNPPLKVLQCGDPTGSGSGGPGYTIPDEKPQKLKPASGGQDGTVVYPRGTLAMAKTTAPNSGGSQFFLVYGDSQLPPDYTVFGTISPDGLAVVDKIAAGGVAPGTDPSTGQPATTDGKPKIPVTIQQAVITG